MRGNARKKVSNASEEEGDGRGKSKAGKLKGIGKGDTER